MKAEEPPLDELAGAVLDGRSVDWASAASSPGAPPSEVVRQLKILAGIAELHRKLTRDTPVSGLHWVSDGKPERWGRLEILERIGLGSFGEVYRAWDPKLDREVAVKLLHTGETRPSPRAAGARGADSSARETVGPEGATVLEEARLLARVRHPNVVTVYDADEFDGRVGLWMEFIHGRTLEQVLAERGRFEDREVTRIGIELCRAITAVHDAGLLHRDVKTQNLMQAADGRLILMDFGTGRELEETSASLLDTAGTPLYLAPETFVGAPATVRGDVYSAGVVLFHLLTGSYPVRGATVGEVADAHARGERLDLVAEAHGVNRTLAAAVNRALEPDPSRRFESARALLAALQSVENETAERTAMRQPSHGSRRAALIGLGFGLAILLVGAVAWLSLGGAPLKATLRPLPFQARDWVLVSHFENRTAEKLFDGTLDQALGMELSSSRHVNVATRERVGDSLRLMKKPAATRIDAALGREVCLRDGGIRALLTGRVEKLGNRYLYSVELVDPKENTTLAEFREESTGADGSLPAMLRISNRVRTALGETLPPRQPGTAALATVTTTNLRALQLFSRATALINDEWNVAFGGGAGGGLAAGEKLLREALAEDPEFASAWVFLAFTLPGSAADPSAESQACAANALRFSDKATERERLFIEGSHHFFLRQREKAIAAYEAVLALYPDDYWAANMLAHIYDFEHDPGERQKALEVDTRLADTRPKDFFWNWGAVFDRVSMTYDPGGAELYLRRASALITPEVAEQYPNLVSYLKYVPFIHGWLDGDLWAAAVELDRAASQVDSFVGRARDCLAVHTALGYLTLGRIESAETISGKILDPVVRNDMLAQVAFLKGDAAAARRYLETNRNQKSRKVTEGFLDTTLVIQARLGIGSVPDPRLPPELFGSDETLQIARGEMALARGHTDDGIRELQEGLKIPISMGFIESHYLGKESLAAAFLEKADIPRAIEILERRSDRRNAVVSGTTGAYWLRNRLQLAKLYRRAGRSKEARAVEEELSRLLMLADTDHPILLALQQLKKS